MTKSWWMWHHPTSHPLLNHNFRVSKNNNRRPNLSKSLTNFWNFLTLKRIHIFIFFRISLYSLQEMHNLSNAAENLPRLQNANSFFITVFCDLESRPDSMVQGRWNRGGTDLGRNEGITLSFKWPCISICSPSPGFSDLPAALWSVLQSWINDVTLIISVVNL